MIEMSTLDGVIARASERLGYSTLRPNQYKAIKSFLEGKNVFVTYRRGAENPCAMPSCHLLLTICMVAVGSIALIVIVIHSHNTHNTTPPRADTERGG